MSTPRILPVIRLLIGSLLLASISSAQVVFTVTATADSTGNGYTASSSYTFVFTADEDFTTGGNNQFSGTNNRWGAFGSGDDQLWTSISGTGVSGTYSQPADPTYSIRAHAGNGGNGALVLQARDNSEMSVGLTSLGADTITAISASMDSTTLASTFNFPGSFTALDTYFTNFAGTYSSLATTGNAEKNRISLTFVGESTVTFTPTSLSISAVPEPSSFALIAGFAALGIIGSRRRRRVVSC